MNNKRINKYIPEVLALILYMVCMIIIMYFHEPWFDEAQAWLIARDASLKEILFVLPHYEGHPPIWHLVLLPLAKLGAPFEFSIKLVSLTFCSIAMGLFIFKAPFKRIIKLTIPFTYFFFYQYGVISRPYCILMLGFILCAMFYKTKNIKPVRFILALGILCSASAYGIILSVGIAMAWLFEIFYKDFSINSIKKFCYDKRFFALIILLLFNLILVVSIIPKSDTYATNGVMKNSYYISRVIYMFFVLPGDATYLDISNYFNQNIKFNMNTVFGVIGSSIISITLILLAKRNNKLLLLLVPYTLIAIFSSFVYFYPHHTGIITLFFLFIIWCCIEDRKEKTINYSAFLRKLIRNESDIALLNKIPKILFGIIICTSFFWSIGSSVIEIYTPYGYGRDLATFIKDNNIDKYNIMTSWKDYTDSKTKERILDTNLIYNTEILPYFNKNIFYNLNNNAQNKSFVTHKLADNDENIEKWKEIGYPDVIIGDVNLQRLFGDSLNLYRDYACVYEAKGSYIWKAVVLDYESLVYIKKDIMSQFPNLKEIEPYKLN